MIYNIFEFKWYLYSGPLLKNFLAPSLPIIVHCFVVLTWKAPFNVPNTISFSSICIVFYNFPMKLSIPTKIRPGKKNGGEAPDLLLKLSWWIRSAHRRYNSEATYSLKSCSTTPRLKDRSPLRRTPTLQEADRNVALKGPFSLHWGSTYWLAMPVSISRKSKLRNYMMGG